MKNAAILITGILAALGIFAAVYAGHSYYKEARFKSYLKAVGLPTATGYMGGTYPKWAPVEFTYKQYKGSPGIEDPEFFTEVGAQKFLKGSCWPVPMPAGFIETTPEKIDALAEADPDAMYYKYFLAENRYDNETAIQYLRKAAALGHVVANIDLIDYMDDRPDEQARILGLYSKITPYAEYKRIHEMLFPMDIPRIFEVIRGSNQFPWVLVFLYPPDDDANPVNLAAIPGYREYLCEACFRGCITSLPDGVKCSE